MKDFETQIVQLISNLVERKVLDLHTAIPGIVESFDPDKMCADVQIAIKRQFVDGSTEAVAVLPCVPVAMPGGSSFANYHPLEKGDIVQLIFNERALDNFKLGDGGILDPSESPRFHNYMDAVAIPSLAPQKKVEEIYFTDARKVNTSSFISYAGGFIGIDADGKVYLGKIDGTENEPLVLGNVLVSFLTALKDHLIVVLDEFINTGASNLVIGNLGAPCPLNPGIVTNLTAEKAAIEATFAEFVDTASTNIISQTAFTER